MSTCGFFKVSCSITEALKKIADFDKKISTNEKTKLITNRYEKNNPTIKKERSFSCTSNNSFSLFGFLPGG